MPEDKLGTTGHAVQPITLAGRAVEAISTKIPPVGGVARNMTVSFSLPPESAEQFLTELSNLGYRPTQNRSVDVFGNDQQEWRWGNADPLGKLRDRVAELRK